MKPPITKISFYSSRRKILKTFLSLLDQNNDTMNLDCYTQHIPLTSKARFWSNFVSALKGKAGSLQD